MSINEMDSKIKELRELRRMADELAAEMETIQDRLRPTWTPRAWTPSMVPIGR